MDIHITPKWLFEQHPLPWRGGEQHETMVEIWDANEQHVFTIRTGVSLFAKNPNDLAGIICAAVQSYADELNADRYQPPPPLPAFIADAIPDGVKAAEAINRLDAAEVRAGTREGDQMAGVIVDTVCTQVQEQLVEVKKPDPLARNREPKIEYKRMWTVVLMATEPTDISGGCDVQFQVYDEETAKRYRAGDHIAVTLAPSGEKL